jgi:hypothetical protein
MQFGGTSGCSSAQGVDLFVALNQNKDKTGVGYALNSAMRAAVCAIDWSQVEPYPTFFLIEQ